MKYVALLSGGKDSCYNLVHCHKNGHELVAAASLRPKPGIDEIDSYMYQTVGQDAIEFVAQALDVPLYRRVISGTAIDQSSDYGTRDVTTNGGWAGDETEDLYELLVTVKSSHPEVEGVSVGAILSNYQRVRVEHVCRRLSLVPLSFLWQRNQGELLNEMIEAGLEAVLIKTAGIGLRPDHLGQTLAQMQPTLQQLHKQYGAHVCGEGGEYETLTLDCPLFKQRIRLTETETMIHSDNGFATVAYLRVKSAVLEHKTTQQIDPSIPPLVDQEHEQVMSAVDQSVASKPPYMLAPLCTPDHASLGSEVPTKVMGDWVYVSNIHRKAKSMWDFVDVEDEVNVCFNTLREKLDEYDLELKHCTHINIYVSNMAYFARVNAIYATFFGSSPPTRACVEVDLPQPHQVLIDCTAYNEMQPSDRQALHVQGLSYWAPANIGPYSQAVTVENQRVYISGQIGLLPHCLEMQSPRSFKLELALACQHVDRIVGALKTNAGGGWEGHIQLSIYWLESFYNLPHVRHASRTIDPDAIPLFVGVPALPKSALVEKQVVAHTGRFFAPGEDESVEVRTLKPSIREGAITGSQGRIEWRASSFANNMAASAVIWVRGTIDEQMVIGLNDPLESILPRAFSVRVFYRPTQGIQLGIPQLLSNSGFAVTSVACRWVASATAEDWDYAVCIIGV